MEGILTAQESATLKIPNLQHKSSFAGSSRKSEQTTTQGGLRIKEANFEKKTVTLDIPNDKYGISQMENTLKRRKLQTTVTVDQDHKNVITLNSAGIEMQRNLRDGNLVNRWKEQLKWEGDQAMSHFYIDYDRDKKLNWFTIMNVLLNSQAKNHHKLVSSAKKSQVDFDVEDFFEARKTQLQKYKETLAVPTEEPDCPKQVHPAPSRVESNLGSTKTQNFENQTFQLKKKQTLKRSPPNGRAFSQQMYDRDTLKDSPEFSKKINELQDLKSQVASIKNQEQKQRLFYEKFHLNKVQKLLKIKFKKVIKEKINQVVQERIQNQLKDALMKNATQGLLLKTQTLRGLSPLEEDKKSSLKSSFSRQGSANPFRQSNDNESIQSKTHHFQTKESSFKPVINDDMNLFDQDESPEQYQLGFFLQRHQSAVQESAGGTGGTNEKMRFNKKSEQHGQTHMQKSNLSESRNRLPGADHIIKKHDDRVIQAKSRLTNQQKTLQSNFLTRQQSTDLLQQMKLGQSHSQLRIGLQQAMDNQSKFVEGRNFVSKYNSATHFGQYLQSKQSISKDSLKQRAKVAYDQIVKDLNGRKKNDKDMTELHKQLQELSAIESNEEQPSIPKIVNIQNNEVLNLNNGNTKISTKPVMNLRNNNQAKHKISTLYSASEKDLKAFWSKIKQRDSSKSPEQQQTAPVTSTALPNPFETKPDLFKQNEMITQANVLRSKKKLTLLNKLNNPNGENIPMEMKSYMRLYGSLSNKEPHKKTTKKRRNLIDHHQLNHNTIQQTDGFSSFDIDDFNTPSHKPPTNLDTIEANYFYAQNIKQQKLSKFAEQKLSGNNKRSQSNSRSRALQIADQFTLNKQSESNSKQKSRKLGSPNLPPKPPTANSFVQRQSTNEMTLEQNSKNFIRKSTDNQISTNREVVSEQMRKLNKDQDVQIFDELGEQSSGTRKEVKSNGHIVEEC